MAKRLQMNQQYDNMEFDQWMYREYPKWITIADGPDKTRKVIANDKIEEENYIAHYGAPGDPKTAETRAEPMSLRGNIGECSSCGVEIAFKTGPIPNNCPVCGGKNVMAPKANPVAAADIPAGEHGVTDNAPISTPPRSNPFAQKKAK